MHKTSRKIETAGIYQTCGGCQVVVFNYDGYKPSSAEDSKAHQKALARAGLDPSYQSGEVWHPAVTHVTHIKAKYKIITI